MKKFAFVIVLSALVMGCTVHPNAKNTCPTVRVGRCSTYLFWWLPLNSIEPCWVCDPVAEPKE